MAKRVILGPKPQQHKQVQADDWVNGNSANNASANPSPNQDISPPSEASASTVSEVKSGSFPDSPMKRLTIDVPELLHAQIKSSCAIKGVKMADEIRALLENHFLKSDSAS